MGRRAWALLERRLRSARHLGQHLQRFDHRLLAHIVAPDRTEPTLLVGDVAIARCDGEMHQPHGLARRCAAGTGDARDRNRKIDIGVFECAERHCGRGFLAHRAEGFERGGLDAQHGVLGVVGIGDEAAIDHVG